MDGLLAIGVLSGFRPLFCLLIHHLMRFTISFKMELNAEQEEIFDLIEELTTTGKDHLNSQHMSKLKSLCKNGGAETIKFVHTSLMDQMEQEHSQIRYSAFQIVCQLFPRSHLFRDLVARDFCRLLRLTADTHRIQYPVALPEKISKKLKKLVLRVVNAWYKVCFMVPGNWCFFIPPRSLDILAGRAINHYY